MTQLMEEDNPLYDKLCDLGANMDTEGFILETLRYVLQPLFGTLPKKELHELFFFELKENLGYDTALAYLWFGLSIHKGGNNDDLPFFTSDTHLEITDGEVMYRKLLAKIAGRLASDSDTAKKIISYVLIRYEAEFKTKGGRARYTPEDPKRARETHFGYFHFLLTLFTDADDLCIIESTNLAPLMKWLKDNGKPKLAKMISDFDPDEPFTKRFTGRKSVPATKAEDPDLQEQCSKSGTTKLVYGSNSIAVGEQQSDELESYRVDESGGAPQKRELFKKGQQESGGSTGGSTDEVGQKKSS